MPGSYPLPMPKVSWNAFMPKHWANRRKTLLGTQSFMRGSLHSWQMWMPHSPVWTELWRASKRQLLLSLTLLNWLTYILLNLFWSLESKLFGQHAIALPKSGTEAREGRQGQGQSGTGTESCSIAACLCWTWDGAFWGALGCGEYLTTGLPQKFCSAFGGARYRFD